MTPAEIITGIIATAAFVVSILAFKQSKRAAKANEDSALHASRANELTLVQQFQSYFPGLMAEMEKEKAAGNLAGFQALQYTANVLVLELFRKLVQDSDAEGRQKFSEYFRGFAQFSPDATPGLEKFLSEMFGDKYEPPKS